MDPVIVHIASTDVPSPPRYRTRHSTECRTVVITIDDPVQKLVDQDADRVEFWVQPLDFDVTICHSRAQAQGRGNAPAATQTNPDGSYIPKSNTGLTGPFKGNDDMWIVSGGNASPYPNRVSVTITRCTVEPIP